VIVNVNGTPLHVAPPKVYTGVTVMVEIIGELVVFVAVNEEISPVPLAASPIDEFEFVQL
jgi:hypothetical protein